MKKTISINISGLMFNIDEDAFARLSQYLGSIKKHFEGREGQADIIADIESRIAELLQTHLHETKQVITIEDVNEVIAALGQPFEMDEDDSGSNEGSTKPYSFRRKRLFRDPDNRKISGVAAGIAAYFAIDPLWIRIIFVLLLFGSGAGLLIYIVLWILTPEARTTAEKLEMRGEPVNVDNIEKSIKEEFEKVSTKINEFAGEAKDGLNRAGRQARYAAGRANDPVIEVLRVIARIFSIVFGLLFLALGLLLILIAGSVFLGWDEFSLVTDMELPLVFGEHLFPLVLSSPLAISLAPIALGGFIAIPLIMLVYSGLRLLIGEYFKIPGLGSVASGLWIACVVGIFYIGTTLAIDFKETYSTDKNTTEISVGDDEIITVSLLENENIRKRKSMQLFDMHFRTGKNGDESVYVYPLFYVDVTDKEISYIETSISSKGGTYEKAKDRAESIDFKLVVDSSKIILPEWFSIGEGNSMRDQKVVTRLYIPEGQIVYFDAKMENYFSGSPRYSWRNKKFAGNYWIMTKDGLQPYKPALEGESAL
ncbi:MAG: PspC domain-containing protein [Bacteroidales bacterium]|nr:PspC domain-containing protein [Bacteroidales bacterium]